jgi:hypothetical protein
MNHSPLSEKELEEVKKKRGLDAKIAEKHGIPAHKVERELDPRLRKLILKYLNQPRPNR